SGVVCLAAAEAAGVHQIHLSALASRNDLSCVGNQHGPTAGEIEVFALEKCPIRRGEVVHDVEAGIELQNGLTPLGAAVVGTVAGGHVGKPVALSDGTASTHPHSAGAAVSAISVGIGTHVERAGLAQVGGVVG